MSRTRATRPTVAAERGQALVEFSFTILILVGLLLGIFDLGRAVYMNNGVAQAAREIARVASVHPGSPITTLTADAQAVVDAQQDIIHSLSDPTLSCVDIMGAPDATPGGDCLSGSWVKVQLVAEYQPVTPIFSLMRMSLDSSSSIQIP